MPAAARRALAIASRLASAVRHAAIGAARRGAPPVGGDAQASRRRAELRGGGAYRSRARMLSRARGGRGAPQHHSPLIIPVARRGDAEGHWHFDSATARQTCRGAEGCRRSLP